MFRFLLLCCAVILVVHQISGSPISQIHSDEEATTTDNTVEIYLRDEEDQTEGVTAVNDEAVTEPGATVPTKVIFRQESEEQVAEEGEDDSEEGEDGEDRETAPARPAAAQSGASSSQSPSEEGQVNPQAPAEESQVNQQEGQANQQESQVSPQEGQVSQQEGQVNPPEGQANQQEAQFGEGPFNQQEGQVNQSEGQPSLQEGQTGQQEESPAPVVQGEEPEDQGQETGQISQQEAARPPTNLQGLPPSAPAGVAPGNAETGPVFNEFGENTIPAAREPVVVMSTGARPLESLGAAPARPSKPVASPPKKTQSSGALQPAVFEPLPFGESQPNFQISEFEEENDHPPAAEASGPLPPPVSTVKPSTGKYKITNPKTTTVAPTTAVPTKGGSFAEEWNNTNSVFMLSPQGRKECECGKVPFKVDDADKAGINEYPWTIAVVRTGIFGGGRPHCGGTLINDLYVLSAAHCFSGQYADSVQIWLTAHNSLQSIDNFIPSDRVLKRDVAEILMHPNYDSRNYENDIALIKLAHPIDISTSSYYVPACLPAGVGTYEGMQARVTGWGSAAPSNSNNRLSPNKMCKDDVPIVGNDVCNRDTSHKNRITSNHMCAGLLTSKPTESCLGDSGGPLMLPNNGRYTVIGITSHGYTTPRRAYTPVVYTRVGNYADWILHNTRDAEWCHL